MKLASYLQGRDNNFNLIRIVAASLVLVTHSFVLVTGSPNSEPLRTRLGLTLGTIAVDVFFIASGFLVYNSLLRSQSLLEFCWARILRIYPALVVMLFLTVFGLGPVFTTRSLSAYLASSQTYLYLAKCGTLLSGVEYLLPGVFERNPYRASVNGSLWTLPYEIKMYLALAAVWAVARTFKQHRIRIVEVTVISCALLSGVVLVFLHLHEVGEGHFLRLFFMFFTGAACYVLRERLWLSTPAFWILLLATVVSAFVHSDAFFVVYTLACAYVLFYVAFVPKGPIRAYNRLGDYSYGVYIYAFPVQQAIATSFPGVTVIGMLLASGAVTFGLAMLSWHFVERHALGQKGRYVAWVRRLGFPAKA